MGVVLAKLKQFKDWLASTWIGKAVAKGCNQLASAIKRLIDRIFPSSNGAGNKNDVSTDSVTNGEDGERTNGVSQVENSEEVMFSSQELPSTEDVFSAVTPEERTGLANQCTQMGTEMLTLGQKIGDANQKVTKKDLFQFTNAVSSAVIYIDNVQAAPAAF